MPRIVILGAGISGLALAYQLTRTMPQAQITVLEKETRPGGTMWTERREGFQVELGPNGFLDNKPSTLELCRDLGLSDQLQAASEASARNRYLFLGDGLVRLPNSLLSFLKFDLLSWRGKLSLLLERFRRRRTESADESIADFVSRRLGKEAGLLADAFVTGIHAGDPVLLSVRSAFPRLAQFEAEHGSVFKGLSAAARQRRREAAARGEKPSRGSRMWSCREGLGRLATSLSERLSQPPILGVAVQSMVRHEPGWLVQGEGRDQWPADVVVLTCPAYEQARILEAYDAELAQRVGEIVYNRVAVVALGYRQADIPCSLDGFGFLTPQRLGRNVLGVQWCSSIFPQRAPPGHVLLRAMCGGWNKPEMVDWDDGRLSDAVRLELRLALGVEAAPTFSQIVRWQRAIPQYHLGHGDRLAWIAGRLARHPGLYLGGNAYYGVALNDCTEQAKLLAARIGAFLTLQGPLPRKADL